MPETTLEDRTYEADQKGREVVETNVNIVFTSYSAVTSNINRSWNDVITLHDELAEFDQDSRKRIYRGLSQTKTKSLGSFAKYIDD